MFECHWMILDRALQIGLRRITGITRFGEQAQIGQAQLGHQASICFLYRRTSRTLKNSIGEGQQKQRRQEGEKDKRAE